MELQEYEKAHLKVLDEISSECVLFLKRSNNDFPLDISQVKEIGLYGNGVRYTVKGGTGSGNVEYHFFNNIEQAFENKNIKITSKEFLDEYDKIIKKEKEKFVKRMKKEGKEAGIAPVTYFFGKTITEPNYDLDNLIHPNEISIYVISRKMGEGSDRENIKGQYKLSDTEIRNIKYLSKNSKKFLLVINSGAPLDLSEIVDDVDNILLISYLGSLTSETLVKIVFGESYPSGKLPVTWDKYDNYPSQNFGDINDTYYEEGVFIGYRYFTSVHVKPHFSFGFGLGYTTFDYKLNNVSINGETVNIQIEVKNTGDYLGKEVIQIYLSKPSYSELENPAIELVAYHKTKELKPNEVEDLYLNFKISEFANFDTAQSAYILKKGVYLISFGNSSDNLQQICSFEIKEDVLFNKVESYKQSINLKEKSFNIISDYKPLKKHFIINLKEICIEKRENNLVEKPSYQEINQLSNEELIQMTVGNISVGLKGLIGDSCESVLGGASETCRHIKSIANSLTFADGPAGVRIASECIISKNKKYKISVDPMWQDLANYLPKIVTSLILNKKNSKRKGERYYQYTTSIPVANALAASFNPDVVYKCGEIISDEMKRFGVDVILSPSMNIIRNPLCGRNFEYYSEDPLLTSSLVISFVNAVQANGQSRACIKHYLCNNQENNRFQSNSNVSIRTIREIYLKSFIDVIKKAKPFSLMTSYNLINGEHSSESQYFIKSVLREELQYTGLVMTDWISTGAINNPHSKHPTIYARNYIKPGINLIMPGGQDDIKDLTKALHDNIVTREELLENVNLIYDKIVLQTKAKS